MGDAPRPSKTPRQNSSPRVIQLPEDLSRWLRQNQEFNLSEFVREEWRRWRAEKRKDWPAGQHRGRLPGGTPRPVRVVTTVALDPTTVHQIDALRSKLPSFNMSRWVETCLREKVGLPAPA
jgi:hypothetical protein